MIVRLILTKEREDVDRNVFLQLSSSLFLRVRRRSSIYCGGDFSTTEESSRRHSANSIGNQPCHEGNSFHVVKGWERGRVHTGPAQGAACTPDSRISDTYNPRRLLSGRCLDNRTEAMPTDLRRLHSTRGGLMTGNASTLYRDGT